MPEVILRAMAAHQSPEHAQIMWDAMLSSGELVVSTWRLDEGRAGGLLSGSRWAVSGGRVAMGPGETPCWTEPLEPMDAIAELMGALVLLSRFQSL